jgi:hypothetical protein
MLFEIYHAPAIWIARTVLLWATFAFTAISWVHYAFLVPVRLRGPQPTQARSGSSKQVA